MNHAGRNHSTVVEDVQGALANERRRFTSCMSSQDSLGPSGCTSVLQSCILPRTSLLPPFDKTMGLRRERMEDTVT